MANDRLFLRWWGCGALDARFSDVNVAFDPYLFGNNLARAEPVFDYIFISHEHFDHCHPPTLRRLCAGDRFKQLFVSPGCIDPDQPIGAKYGDAAFDRDLPITKHVPADRVEVVYPSLCNDRTAVDRAFPGTKVHELGPIRVEMIESGENQRSDLPTCGYLVTHLEKQVSILHTGDLHEPYPALEQLRDRVDLLIHMKLGLTEWGGRELSGRLVELLELVRPRFCVPVHYRSDRAADPVPEGHWPPNVTDVAAFIESIRKIAGNRTTVLPFTAGVEYELALPDLEVLWKWNWYNSWTTPPWRDGG